MKIPGVDTILYWRAREIWDGERAPSDELIQLIDETPYKIDLGRFDEAEAMLAQIRDCNPEPSQVMRMCFLKGQLSSDRKLLAQAYAQYFEALHIAEEHGDLDSWITLTDHAGRMMYGLMKNHEALANYQMALKLWHERATQLRKPRAEPEVRYLERIGTAQWLVGNIDDAQATLARALTLAMRTPKVPHTDFLRRTAAHALWSLALVLRSQSDMNDGGINLINTALKRMRTAVGIYDSVATYDVNKGRLHTQIAELYLDLSEMHLLSENDDSKRLRGKDVSTHLRAAADFLRPTNDVAGRLLIGLTRLRRSITRRPDRNALWETQEFESELQGIQSQAEEMKDAFLIAKVATLRGERLLWLGDPEPARVALLEAISAFQNEGMGMATRAQRLLRRSNATVQAIVPRRVSRRRSTQPPPSDPDQP